MALDVLDVEYWRDVETLTVWQAAFIVCDIEPWDEPISANASLPQAIEEIRGVLLASVPHYKTGCVFANNGWSCKTQRPAQLSGLYFSRDDLRTWATTFYANKPLPLIFSSE